MIDCGFFSLRAAGVKGKLCLALYRVGKELLKVAQEGVPCFANILKLRSDVHSFYLFRLPVRHNSHPKCMEASSTREDAESHYPPQKGNCPDSIQYQSQISNKTR